MPLPEEYKKDWDSRDLLGIDPDIDITTKVAVKNNSPSDLLIGVLLANTELNIVPVGNKIGYGTTYDAKDKAMSSGITEKLARELYTDNVTKTIQNTGGGTCIFETPKSHAQTPFKTVVLHHF